MWNHLRKYSGLFSRKAPTQRTRRATKRTHRLLFEGLEDRVLPAFAFAVQISDLTTPNVTTTTYNYSGGADLDGNPAIAISDTVGDFSVNFEIVVTNSPGGPSISFLSQSANSIRNNAATA